MSAAIDLHFLNVGQGDGFLIRFPDRRTILIDGGKNSELLRNYLDDLDCCLTTLLLTHNDADHIAAAATLLADENFSAQLKQVVYLKDAAVDTKIYTTLESRLQALRTRQPDLWSYDLGQDPKPVVLPLDFGAELQLGILAPSPSILTQQTAQRPGNNEKCGIFALKYAEDVVLYGADLDVNAWTELIEQNYELKAYLFTVSHHGAPGPRQNTGRWINWESLIQRHIQPKIAFISVGSQQGGYGHPLPEVFVPLREQGTYIACSNTTSQCVLHPEKSLPLFKMPSGTHHTPCKGSLHLTLQPGHTPTIHGREQHEQLVAETFASCLCRT